MELLGLEFCALVSEVTGSRRVNILSLDKKTSVLTILASTLGEKESFDVKGKPLLLSGDRSIIFIPALEKYPEALDHPYTRTIPNAKSVVGCLLHEDTQFRWMMVAWNPIASFFTNDEAISLVERLFHVAQKFAENNFKGRLELLPARQPKSRLEGFAEDAASFNSEPISSFLFETLIPKKRLLARNGISFLALRQWRKPIKPYQLKAVMALKASEDHVCVNEIALEIVDQVQKVYGNLFTHVVPIPGGNSGRKRSFSVLIAEAVAKLLDLPCRNVLVGEDLAVGKSHPKKSTTLKPYTLSEEISGNVLIVDDITTSGKHIELATLALRQTCNYCTAVVWIAD